jgi:excisionase family DNA binding protein
VARRWNVPERTIRHWARTGQIPAVKFGRKIWRFRLGDVESLAARFGSTAAPEGA